MPLPLPIEIVVCILESLVAFPDVMGAYPIRTDAFLPLNDIKRSIRSLSLLALVCKQWNTICTPILYQCLVIDDSTVTNVLLNTLESSRTTSRLQPLGCLTRHLIIALSDHPRDEVEFLGNRILQRFGNLGKLARCLPCLQILSISITIPAVLGLPMPYYGRDFAPSITQTSAQSLRKLYLHQNPIVLFSRRELRSLLESTPNLVALLGAGYIGCPLALPYLPKLKYLAIASEAVRCDGNDHKDRRASSLEHIHLGPVRSPTVWAHVLSAWGSKLTSVSLDLRFPIESALSPTSNLECLQILSSLCPNITHLEIFIISWHCFPQADLFPPVECLSIHLVFNGVTVTDICGTLTAIRLPSLKVVRFLDPEMDEWLASPQSGNVDGAWKPLLEVAFRVVNSYGHQLGPSEHHFKRRVLN